MAEAGDRVGAILDTDAEAKVVRWFGWGTYDGDFPYPGLAGMLNPRITLDTGETVWGAECWWGDRGAILKRITEYHNLGYSIKLVNIADAKELGKIH
jgi:hypothetical protein